MPLRFCRNVLVGAYERRGGGMWSRGSQADTVSNRETAVLLSVKSPRSPDPYPIETARNDQISDLKRELRRGGPAGTSCKKFCGPQKKFCGITKKVLRDHERVLRESLILRVPTPEPPPNSASLQQLRTAARRSQERPFFTQSENFSVQDDGDSETDLESKDEGDEAPDGEKSDLGKGHPTNDNSKREGHAGRTCCVYKHPAILLDYSCLKKYKRRRHFAPAPTYCM
ncbi:hypothetical protein DFH08DRAFT_826868 [Mycena albidolilacea]|uniref:Uncharacterized protein n=1 Tax=Mycena albidolilacea TaxID=1033008 RepID=A0AAD6YYZ8_9AGAR|nr:hypothetical protein DFH08DRAFT_826868 [Mycena albidolilacea]